MTFRDQTARAGWVGAAGAVMALLLSLIARDGDGTGPVAGLILVALGVTAVAVVFFLVARPLHRMLWFRALRPSTLRVLGRTPRDRVTNTIYGPALRWWLHLDAEGNDRDGAI